MTMNKSKKLVFAVDFDGTVVTNAYPKIGRNIGAALVLKTLVAEGHKLILYTIRTGTQLEEAVEWFTDKGIDLYAVNQNPGQASWAPDAKKIFFDLCLDDRNYGCPLTDVGTEKVFDWAHFVKNSYGKDWLTSLNVAQKDKLIRAVRHEQKSIVSDEVP
jgi:hypothetical protein